MKARTAAQATLLEQIPNVGPRTASDLRLLGIRVPSDLEGKNPMALYEALNRKTGQRHDPCVLDVFMAAVAFMGGGKAKPWWSFTARRKAILG